jgi:hypothetical protein
MERCVYEKQTNDLKKEFIYNIRDNTRLTILSDIKKQPMDYLMSDPESRRNIKFYNING